MSGELVAKSAVSVTDMARMVGLSRARFYQLAKKGVFPTADQEPETGRPFYGEEKQRQCLDVRRTNRGINGTTVLFYARRRDVGQKKSARPTVGKVKQVVSNEYMDVIDGLAALNVTATVAQVAPLVRELFPNGIDDVDPGEVIRAVFLRIQRQNPGDKQG